jgi:TolB-like protein
MAARRYVYALLALVLLSVVGVGVFRLVTRNKVIDSVAVLPFTNAGADPNMEYLSDGITENLINRLSQLPELRVVPRSTVFRYKGQDVDPQAMGRALGVRAVIMGRVVQRGDTLSIQTELIDVVNESQLWGEQYNRRLTDLLTIQEEIARGVVEKLRLRLSDAEQRQLTRRYTESTEAYQLYLRGRYFWNKRTGEGMRKGVEYFRQAIDLDPGYSLAYAGLADSYNFMGAFGIALLPPGEAMPKAKAAAMKALEIDDSLAEAHTSLAFIRLYYDWDWPGAERGFQRAIELNPNYAPAHQWYSHLLMARSRTSESISEAKRAVELDPLSLPANLNLGWQYHWGRQYDLAVEHLGKLLEMDPNFEQGHWGLGLAYELKGMSGEAAAEFQKAIALSGGNPVYVAALGHAYAIGGKKADATRVRDELEEQLKLRYVPPFWIAILYVGLGEHEQALKWLEKAYAERSGGLIWLGVEPRMDSLRSDPRFAALMQRVGLSQ